MQNKVKKFSHKLLALFMAIVMLLTCFSGALTAFAANSDQTKYVDGDVEYNNLAWNVLSDEQLATAILDFADSQLPALQALEGTIHDMVDGMSVSVLKISHSMSSRQITVKALGITLATVTLKLGSVDELIETINSVQSVLDGGLMSTAQNLGIDLGAVFDLDLSALGSEKQGKKLMRRSNTTSCDIVRGVLGILYDNNDTVFGRVLRGEFSLGVVDGAFNVYKLIGDMIGMSADKIKENPVYNIAQSMLFNYTEWFTPDEIAAYENGTKDFKYDEVLLDKLTVELLDKISVPVTYDEREHVSSESRYAEIKSVMDNEGKTYAQAAAQLGYDPNLVYSDEFVTSAGVYQNVLLFAYGSPDEKGLATKDTQIVRLEKSDSLFDFGYKALDFAWKTVLKDTIKLIHVNNDVDRGHGSNFDNEFFYWMNGEGRWNKTDIASNYTMANVIEWANALTKIDLSYKDGQWVDGYGNPYTNTTDKIEKVDGKDEPVKDKDGRVIQQAEVQRFVAYGAADTDEFIGWVRHNYEFDRTKVADAKGNWQDIDATTLFNKLRYSPLADYVFDMQTGPINLYFMQTGTPNLDQFFAKDYSKYSSMVAGFNDCLAAAVADLFPDRDNIYINDKGDTNRPTMQTTGDIPTINSTTVSGIASTLVDNALLMVQYVADTTDQNILGGFTGGTLSEENLEEAMLPLLIACIGQVWLNSNGKLCDIIHEEDWNACKDAEGVAYLALKEYLSYVIPNKDYSGLVSKDTNGKFVATLEGTILPMARDAVIYVIEPYVPVTTTDGKPFKAEEGSTVDTTTDVFDLFNSVVCYYADSYSFKNANRQGEKALAAGPLFGLCDTNANSTVNRSNTLWQNLDTIANELLPILGQLQGNGKGNFNSESLIMGDIVNGFLEIGEQHSGTNMYGVTNFIYRLLTFISADPIQKNRVIDTVYDFLADTFNALFGPRYDGQQWVPIPTRTESQANPFDDLVQKTSLAGTGSNNVGAVQKLINNFVEFSGYGYNGVATYKDSILPGLTFAVSAVNSFFGFLPFIDNHNLRMATASVADSVFQGCTDNSDYTTTATLTNNATGINSAYLNGRTGNVDQMSRYYVKITGVDIAGTTTNTNVTGLTSNLISPGKSADVTVTTRFKADSNNSSSYAITFNYQICLANGTVIHDGLKTTTYQYLTGARSWRETVYGVWHDADSNRPYTGWYMSEAYENNSADKTMDANGYKAYTTSTFAATGSRANKLSVGYPGEIVLSTDNLKLVDDLGVRIRNIRWGLNSDARAVDGIYYYDTEPIVNSADGSTFTPGQANAVPVFDKKTGAILNLEKYDISLDDGKTWSYTGLTSDEVDAKFAEIQKAGTDITNATTRTHVVYTFDQIKNSGALAAYHVNEIGQYENMYLQSYGSGEFRYDTLLGKISVRGPIDGFYFNPVKYEVPANTSLYFHFLKYDGTTDVPYTDKTANVCFYNGTLSATAQLHFIICDNDNASAVDERIKSVQTILSNYKESDFNNGSETYKFVQNSVVKGLASTALPITPDTAAKLSDTTEFTYVTADTTSTTGDNAFTPLTTADYNALSDELKAKLYYENGKYYYNADHTQPVYSHTPLTSATGSADSMGIPVEPVTDDNNVVTYKVTNTPKMATKWVNTGIYKDYPCQLSTGSQATNNDGKGIYEQIQWSYYNAAGRKVSSTSTWVIKVPDMSNQLITPTESQDTRGIYTQCRDLLDYTVSEVVNKDLKTGIADRLLKQVSLVRQDLSEKNFDVVTYNAMVSMAKDIEGLYSVEVSYVKDGKTVNETLSYANYAKLVKDKNATINSSKVVSSLSSTQVDEYLRLFGIYMDNVVERGYLGDQLEAEILCASGNEWKNMVGTPAVYGEDGKLVTAANVAKASGAADPRFGEWDTNGNLVNDGQWSDASWNNYVEKLAAAVNVATIGNDSSYAKNNAIYDPDFDYAACVTRAYDADTLLQMAEIALTPLESVQVTVADVPGATVTINGEVVTGSASYEVGTSIKVEVTAADGYTYQHMLVNGEKEFRNPYTIDLKSGMDAITIAPVVEANKPAGFNVSASLVVATSAAGATENTGVCGDYTVTIKNGEDVVATDTFALTKDANTFSFEAIPSGTYTVVIESEYSLIRNNITLVVGDADVAGGAIPIVACDFNSDTFITAADAGYVYSNMGQNAPAYDLNGDTFITAADAGFVYSCMGASTLPAQTIA